MKTAFSIFVFLGLGGGPSELLAQERNLASQAVSQLSVRQLTDQGLEALQNKNFAEAQKHFLQALAQEPMNPSLRINLGLSFEALQEPQKALREYLLAAQTAAPQSEAKFVALFNTARLYGEFGDTAAALDFYQQALAIQPMSKEVKTNIELLLKKKPPSQSQCQSGDQKQQQSSNKGKQNQPQPQSGQEPENKKPQNSQGSQRNQQGQAGEQKKELSKKQIQNILDNITQQEKKIHKRLNEKKPQQNRQGKNW